MNGTPRLVSKSVTMWPFNLPLACVHYFVDYLPWPLNLPFTCFNYVTDYLLSWANLVNNTLGSSTIPGTLTPGIRPKTDLWAGSREIAR